MGEFLVNLIQRASGDANLVRPRPLSIFEQAAPISLASVADVPAEGDSPVGPPAESGRRGALQPANSPLEAARPRSAEDTGKLQPPASLVPPAVPVLRATPSPRPAQQAGQESAPRMIPTAVGTPAPQPEQEEKTPSGPLEPAAVLHPASIPRIAPEVASKPAPTPVPLEGGPPEPPTRPALIPERIPDLPMQTAAPAEERVDKDGKPAGSAIQIHIGRVEVTAVRPPGKPERQKQQSRSAVMSLEAYLSSREKEGRK